MFPEDFIKRIKNQPYIDYSAFIDAMNRPAMVSIRLNPAKWHLPVSYERVEWEPNGYYLPERPLFTGDPLFHAGVYYPQESSSMFAGEVFRQHTAGINGIRVLDLCGAPGGKATHLSSLIADNGLLVANEVIGQRAAILAENITKWGMGNTIVTQNDPARFASLPGFFDVIMADVPCSGEGMFRSPAAVKEWSVNSALLCSERQRRIVMEVWPALKPGGILIYSTCTFNPAENEENISWLRDNTGSVPLTVNITAKSEIKVVNYKGLEGYGFHPGKVKGDGFFITVIRKQSGGPFTYNKKKKNKHLKYSHAAAEMAEPFISSEHERIIMNNNRIISLAADTDIFSYIDERLTVIKAGTTIGSVKNGKMVPAHDLAMSVKQKKEVWPRHELSYDEAIKYLRLIPVSPSSVPQGRVLISYRGISLGFVNNIGQRINNGYPQAWRIRMDLQDGYSKIL